MPEKNKRRQLPEEVYPIMETCVQEIIEVLKKPENEEHLNGPIYHFVSRDFRDIIRESHKKYVIERMKKAPKSKSGE